MEDYQLRHDIDRLRKFLDELEILYNDKLGETDGRTLKDVFEMYYDQSEVETKTAIVKDDLRTLNNDLGVLSDSLVDFNQTLITFNGDTETLADDLTTLKDNLSSVLTDFAQLKTDLDGFDNRLDTFDGQLDTFDGRLTTFNGNLSQFSDTLTTVNGRVTDLESGLSSLQATVDLLDDTTDNLSSDTMALLNSLSVLVNTLDVFNTYLTDFEGDLNDLEDELSDNNIDTSSLNTNLLNLIVMIGEVKSDVSTVTGVVGDANNGLVKDLNDVQDTIGDTNTAGTVKYEIANTKSIIGNENTGLIKDLNDVQDTIGDNTGGLVKDINDIQSDIGTPTTQNTIKYNIKQLDNTIGDTSTPNTLKYDISQAKSDVSSLETTIGDNNSGLIKNVNKTMSDIGTVQSDITDIQSDISGVQGNISTVQSDIAQTTEDIESLQGELYVGTENGANGVPSDPYEGTVMYDVNNHDESITILDYAISRLVNPSRLLVCIYLSPNATSNNELSKFRDDYNLDSLVNINYWWRTSNDYFYKKGRNILTGNDTWSRYTDELDPEWILISVDTPPISYNGTRFRYWFNPKNKEFYTLDSDSATNWSKAEIDTIIGISRLYEGIDRYFVNDSIYYNEIANINNQLSLKANDSAVSEALSGKANEVHTHNQIDILDAPKWTSLYSGSMGIVKSDDNLVAVRIKTGSTSVPSDNYGIMGSLGNLSIPSKYYPKTPVFSPYLNGMTVMINTNGEIKAIRPAGQVNSYVEINVVYPVG